MQINIQPGNNVSYNFQLPNKKFKWCDGVVLKRIHVQGESFKQRTFKVYFEEDEEVIENLLFDDDQYITQWNTVIPMSSSSLQPGNSVIYEFPLPNKEYNWLHGVLLNRLNVQGESFKHSRFRVYFEKENKICNLLFDDDQYFLQWNTVVPTMSSAIVNIQGAAAKAMQKELNPMSAANLNIQAAAAKAIQKAQLKQHTQSAKKQKKNNQFK
jgi:hypothetical protein